VSLRKEKGPQFSGLSYPSAADFACRKLPALEQAKGETRLDADSFSNSSRAPKKGKIIIFLRGV
jgi:hypothetical protein